jgi:hypothetical protein
MSGGEIAVKTGADGELMMENFLKEIGWKSLSKNIQFDCVTGIKHKSSKAQKERSTHNVDGVFSYDNPLNHEQTDIVLCSSKHNLDKYAADSKVFEFLQEIAYSLECAPDDYTFSRHIGNSKRVKSYKGVLFWVSSNDEEKKLSMVSKVSDEILEDDDQGNPRLKAKDFDSIYLVDNQKATFIVSAIRTAKNLYPGSSIKFLYPHTGRNNETEEVIVAGETMPIQYINTSLLPIVIDADRTYTLLFCDQSFNSEALKRLIWFVIKISGLANSITIFFNDFDPTRHDGEVNFIKQSFRDNFITDKITVSRTGHYDYVTLKEAQRNIAVEGNLRPILKETKTVATAIEDTLDRRLPFGEMMRPIIDSTVLTDSDIKGFLIRKGIYLGKAAKTETVPLLSTLLLSPNELETLRSLLKTKEDKVKSVPRSAKLVDPSMDIKKISTLIRPIINRSVEATLPDNCILACEPVYELYEDKNVFKASFRIQKHNSTKDLISGTQINDATMNFELNNGELDVRMDYTTRESYKFITKSFERIEHGLLSQNVIDNSFFSIKFNLFKNNVDRVNYLLSFMDTSSSVFLKDAQLEYIAIRPDGSLDEDIPFDLNSLKDKVNMLSIGGQRLDTIHYFDIEYKRAILMQSVKIKYSYNYLTEKGFCLLDLDFKNGLSEPDAELQCNLEIKKGRGNRGRSTEPARKFLLDKINIMIKEKYQPYID